MIPIHSASLSLGIFAHPMAGASALAVGETAQRLVLLEKNLARWADLPVHEKPPSLLGFWRHMNDILPPRLQTRPVALLVEMRRAGFKGPGHPAGLLEEALAAAKQREIQDEEIRLKYAMHFLDEEEVSEAVFRRLARQVLKDNGEKAPKELMAVLLPYSRMLPPEAAAVFKSALQNTPKREGEKHLDYWARVRSALGERPPRDLIQIEREGRLLWADLPSGEAAVLAPVKAHFVGAWALFRQAFDATVASGEAPNAYHLQEQSLKRIGMRGDIRLFQGWLGDFIHDPEVGPEPVQALKDELSAYRQARRGRPILTWSHFIKTARALHDALQQEHAADPEKHKIPDRAEFIRRLMEALEISEVSFHSGLRAWTRQKKEIGCWRGIRDHYPAQQHRIPQITEEGYERIATHFQTIECWLNDRDTQERLRVLGSREAFILAKIEEGLPKKWKVLRDCLRMIEREGYNVAPLKACLKRWGIPAHRYSY